MDLMLPTVHIQDGFAKCGWNTGFIGRWQMLQDKPTSHL